MIEETYYFVPLFNLYSFHFYVNNIQIFAPFILYPLFRVSITLSAVLSNVRSSKGGKGQDSVVEEALTSLHVEVRMQSEICEWTA